MAFFKFRKSADETASAPAATQNIETIRQRAKYRLMGASVLVLAGVIGLPLLFDKQPRPIAVDTPIDIPDKNKMQPLAVPSAVVKPVASEAALAATAVSEKTPVKPAPASEIGVITESAEPPKPVSSSAMKTTPVHVKSTVSASKSIANETSKPVSSPVTAKPLEAARAQALLEGKFAENKAESKANDVKATASQPASGEDRFVVQVGAFADNTRAHEIRLKVERAGLKTYAQVAETKDGKRIRVRVGPFASRAEAEKAAEKIKKLNLPAALLTL